MDGSNSQSAYAPPDLADVANGIRRCIVNLMNDLETIDLLAGCSPTCTEAVAGVQRNLVELERLADDLHPPG